MGLFRNAVSRTENQITLRDSLSATHVRSLCRALHQGINDKGYKDITLDFSLCDFVAESFTLPVLPIIVGYREKQEIDFRLIFPQDESLQRLFKNANWAHYINPDEFDAADYEGGHLPALQYNDGQEMAPLVDRVMDLVLSRIPDLQRGHIKALEWSLGEIMDNVLQHAQSPVGGFVQATAYGEKKQVEFVVADGGIGIPESLDMARKQPLALQQAIAEGVTRDEDGNQGNGLYGSYQVAVVSNGAFEINSARAHLIAGHKKGKVDVGSETIPYNGTSVRCRIGFENPGLLEEALRFGGEAHDPPYDYIERKYEDDGNDEMMQLKLVEHINDVRSREGGQRVRTKLENLLNDAPRITIDFSGISVITSSFADEVFGRLFVKMGPRSFMNRLVLLNADKTTDVLIDRAIFQRTQSSANGNGKKN